MDYDDEPSNSLDRWRFTKTEQIDEINNQVAKNITGKAESEYEHLFHR